MSEQITFFKKNKIDLSSPNITITVTDAVATNTGQDFIDFVRNRKNTSAWLTTESTDAANTTLIISMDLGKDVDSIFLLNHNLKAYTIKYWNGSAYVDFSTPISETINTSITNNYNFTSVNTDKIQIIITGTQVADEDKKISQIIVTEKLGQFASWPEIKKLTNSTNKKINRALSGKVHVVETVGAFSCSLSVKILSDDNDLSLIETIYNKNEGVLIWICGGDEAQFSSKRIGYRLQDIFLVRPTDEYDPTFYRGIYLSGIKTSITFQESIE